MTSSSTLGTRTGLFALFAAECSPKKVYALDHSDFIEIARDLAVRNGHREIEFVKQHSRDFNPPERVDVIVHEQMGGTLFDENMIENLRDLKS